jgi:hypothetical protein
LVGPAHTLGESDTDWQGPALWFDYREAANPIRHGLTNAEFARFINTEFGIGWVDRVCGRQLEPCS